MAKAKTPMSDADLETLNKIIRMCEETDTHCKNCDACNLDVDPEKAKNAEQLDTARRLKATYFPTAK